MNDSKNDSKNDSTNDIIVDWNTSRWLVCSSFLFIAPCIYALIMEMYYFAGLLLITSCVSANHWRVAKMKSWRRMADLCVSKISFIVFFTDGALYIRSTPYIVISYTNLIAIIYCYNNSNALYLKKVNNWYKYHILFHLCVAFEQMIVIDNHR